MIADWARCCTEAKQLLEKGAPRPLRPLRKRLAAKTWPRSGACFDGAPQWCPAITGASSKCRRSWAGLCPRPSPPAKQSPHAGAMSTTKAWPGRKGGRAVPQHAALTIPAEARSARAASLQATDARSQQATASAW